MDYFGINSPEDLPKLKEIFEEAMVNPTAMNQPGDPHPQEQVAQSEEELEIAALVVTENGELLEDANGFASRQEGGGEVPSAAEELTENESAESGHNDEEQTQPGDEETGSGDENNDDDTKG